MINLFKHKIMIFSVHQKEFRDSKALVFYLNSSNKNEKSSKKTWIHEISDIMELYPFILLSFVMKEEQDIHTTFIISCLEKACYLFADIVENMIIISISFDNMKHYSVQVSSHKWHNFLSQILSRQNTCFPNIIRSVRVMK